MLNIIPTTKMNDPTTIAVVLSMMIAPSCAIFWHLVMRDSTEGPATLLLDFIN